MSVVGFNDMPFIDRLRPPLTTVAFPHYQLGTEAAGMLLARLAGTPGPVKSMLRRRFAVRARPGAGQVRRGLADGRPGRRGLAARRLG